MPKNYEEKILQDEIKVMDALEKHANENIEKIAKECGFSRQKVWRIIKDLEQRKIIWGYSAITDETAKNLKQFTILVKRSNEALSDEVRKYIFSPADYVFPMPTIKMENIYSTHGPVDWIATFFAPDLFTAKQFVEKTFERFSKYFSEVTLVETLVSVRKNGHKNPRIKEFIDYI